MHRRQLFWFWNLRRNEDEDEDEDEHEYRGERHCIGDGSGADYSTGTSTGHACRWLQLALG
jgi:hypothetical protein